MEATWGRWAYDPDLFVLRFAWGTNQQYEIDLDTCSSSDRILDWIFRFGTKHFAVAEDIGDLVRALHHLFDPQALIAAGREVDPRQTVELRTCSPNESPNAMDGSSLECEWIDEPPKETT